MGKQGLCCHSAGKKGRLVSSIGVRACCWILQITDPPREVVAGEQVSLVLTDRSLVMGCYLLSPYTVVTSPPPVLPALSTLQGLAVLIIPSTLGNPDSSFTALAIVMWPSPGRIFWWIWGELIPLHGIPSQWEWLVNVVCSPCALCPCCQSQGLTLMSFVCPPLMERLGCLPRSPRRGDYFFRSPPPAGVCPKCVGTALPSGKISCLTSPYPKGLSNTVTAKTTVESPCQRAKTYLNIGHNVLGVRALLLSKKPLVCHGFQ